jgi:predicted Zn-dependent protease
MSRPTDLATQVVELVSASAPGAEIAVTVDRRAHALTRFANSAIHQNVAEDTTTVRLTVHLDGRTASASSTLTSAGELADLAARTTAAVRLCPPDPGWPGLTPPDPLAGRGRVDPAIVDVTPATRAGLVRDFVDAGGADLRAAGYCQTTHGIRAFANSAGQLVSDEMTEASIDGVMRTSTSDGVARQAANRLAALDGGQLGARAAAKARAGVDPVEMAPGRYEVVLEPTAVADLLLMFARGFDGKGVAEDRTFFRPGERQFDAAVSFVDDPLDADAVGFTFDADGTPKRRFDIVAGGMSLAAPQDRRTAVVAGTTSTGHGMGALGAFPLNLALQPAGGAVPAEVDGPMADGSVAALVTNVRRGVLVTDHFYTRVLDPRSLKITGLTRNGVWLIENGEVVRPLRNFRFTQSYPEALRPGAVLGIGGYSVPQPNNYVQASLRAPALHLAGWNFTGGASG